MVVRAQARTIGRHPGLECAAPDDDAELISLSLDNRPNDLESRETHGRDRFFDAAHGQRGIAHSIAKFHVVDAMRECALDGFYHLAFSPSIHIVRDRQIADPASLVLVVDDRGDLVVRRQPQTSGDSHQHRVSRFDGDDALATYTTHLDQGFVRGLTMMESRVHEAPVECVVGESQRFGILSRPAIGLRLFFVMGIKAADRDVPEARSPERLDVVTTAAYDEDGIVERNGFVPDKMDQRLTVESHGQSVCTAGFLWLADRILPDSARMIEQRAVDATAAV